jgi:hypothetical protein
MVVFLTAQTRLTQLTMELTMELIMELPTQLMALYLQLHCGGPETIPSLLIVPMQILTMLQFFVIKVS